METHKSYDRRAREIAPIKIVVKIVDAFLHLRSCGSTQALLADEWKRPGMRRRTRDGTHVPYSALHRISQAGYSVAPYVYVESTITSVTTNNYNVEFKDDCMLLL